METTLDATLDDYRAVYAELRAERDRYRAALEKIANGQGMVSPTRYRAIAQAALDAK